VTTVDMKELKRRCRKLGLDDIMREAVAAGLTKPKACSLARQILRVTWESHGPAELARIANAYDVAKALQG
jgi:hypothetical protein